MSGLSSLGVLDMVRRHPHVMRSAFTYSPKVLTAKDIEDLFEVYSLADSASNRKAAENKTVAFWRDYLLEGTLQTVLSPAK